MAAFRVWFLKELRRIGWRELVRQAGKEFTSGAVQGWLRGALPTPSHQVALARITGVPIEFLRVLVWRTEKARDEAREDQRASTREPFRDGPQAARPKRGPKPLRGTRAAAPPPPTGGDGLITGHGNGQGEVKKLKKSRPSRGILSTARPLAA